MIKLFFAFCVIFASASGMLFLASYTDYFNKQRLMRFSRNLALVAGGFFIATMLIGALVALTL